MTVLDKISTITFYRTFYVLNRIIIGLNHIRHIFTSIKVFM